MAKRRKRKRPPWDLGRKVAIWIAEQKARRGPYGSVSALARAVGLDEGTVRRWIQDGTEPLASTAKALADVMQVDLAWLADNAQAWDERREQSLSTVLRKIPEELHAAVARVLSDERYRAAWLSGWEAATPTATPPPAREPQ